MRLVERLNEVWAVYEVGDGLAVLPSRQLYCPLCSEPLLLHDFRCYRHNVTPPLCHCDVHVKCPGCGLFLTFGLPIPPELYPRLAKSRYHGRVLRLELHKLYPDLDKRVLERLRDWGYW